MKIELPTGITISFPEELKNAVAMGKFANEIQALRVKSDLELHEIKKKRN